MVRLYLQYGDTILIHAVKGNHLDIVRALLKKYADVDVQGVVSLLVPYSDFHVLFCNVQLQDFFYLRGAVHNTQILQPTSTGSGLVRLSIFWAPLYLQSLWCCVYLIFLV